MDGSIWLRRIESITFLFVSYYYIVYTHQQKPENFLLTDKTDNAQVKVIDFG